MMKKTICLAIAILAGAALFAFGADDDVAGLRAQGQVAVDDLHHRVADDPSLEPLLDSVCAQKDCRASRLFWYTDLAEAKAAAKATGRPILALYMLGRLDEELSCANSRFFRTLLYSDPSIASVLRDQYVVYWHSVRDVPRVTIELGDGRVIRQTITGNSVHYLLTADGEVLDALPGLVSPKAFREQLQLWTGLHRTASTVGGDARKVALDNYHQTRYMALGNVAWNVMPMWEPAAPKAKQAKQISAQDAARLAMTKSGGEIVMMRQLEPGAMLRTVPAERWVELGEEQAKDVVFSPQSIALIRSKSDKSANVIELLENLRRTVASDTVFNETDLHRRIHQWFLTGEVKDLDSLNERVYRELFLTPSDDPWMGLRPPTIFTAIAQN
jgi:hypothetical protein